MSHKSKCSYLSLLRWCWQLRWSGGSRQCCLGLSNEVGPPGISLIGVLIITHIPGDLTTAEFSQHIHNRRFGLPEIGTSWLVIKLEGSRNEAPAFRQLRFVCFSCDLKSVLATGLGKQKTWAISQCPETFQDSAHSTPPDTQVLETGSHLPRWTCIQEPVDAFALCRDCSSCPAGQACKMLRSAR